MKSHTKPALRAAPAAQVHISLPVQGVLRDVRHAFLGLCIDAGQKVLAAMMEADRVALCGPKGVPDAARRAVRGGTTASQVVLGGQRIAVRRPRARSTTEGELALPSFQWAAGADPLDAATMAAIAAGVSTRRYASTQQPVPAAHQPRAASKSAVSRRFVQLSQEQLARWLARPLGELDLPVVMIDGIHFRDRVILLALGIDAQGHKHVLGLSEGSTGATRVVASLLSDLVERGLDAQRMRLWVIDGGKALRKAIVQTFGACALVQRCQEHKRRNVLEHLPEDAQAGLSGGLPGRFDGGIVGYGLTPSVRIDVVGGEPVEFRNIDSKRRFVGANLDASGVLERWYGSVFGIRQTVDGILDREAVGAELRYLDPQTTMYAVLDYDTSFKALNAASLQGSWTSAGRTSINLLWDRRRAPTLDAVFGQPTSSIRDLLATMSEDEIRQLAATVTAVATQGLIGLTTPLSEHWQVGADARLVKVGALPEVVVNGVTMPAQPATGNVISYSLQSIGSNLYSSRDSSVFTLMLVNGPTYDSWLVTYDNVTGLFERFSFEPALRYYQQRDMADVRLARVSPSLRLSWRPTQASVLEIDYLLVRTRTTAPTTSDTTTRHFLSVGYRLDL